jgi:hypothetical protein
MPWPKLSIVISVYNAESTFLRYRRRVHQFKGAILAGYWPASGPSVQSRPRPAARNTRERASRGEYLAILDADAAWLPYLFRKVTRLTASSVPCSRTLSISQSMMTAGSVRCRELVRRALDGAQAACGWEN